MLLRVSSSPVTTLQSGSSYDDKAVALLGSWNGLLSETISPEWEISEVTAWSLHYSSSADACGTDGGIDGIIPYPEGGFTGMEKRNCSFGKLRRVSDCIEAEPSEAGFDIVLHID